MSEPVAPVYLLTCDLAVYWLFSFDPVIHVVVFSESGNRDVLSPFLLGAAISISVFRSSLSSSNKCNRY